MTNIDKNKNYDVLILGGGPSGLTAAIYTSRASLTTLVLAGSPPGGQLMWTTDVENYPGFPDGIMGPDLILNMRKQAIRFGSTVYDENVLSITGNVKDNFKVQTDSNNTYIAKTIIVATGASAKWLNLPSEQKLRAKGVSACATCDGFFFKDKIVGVVGGGDAAMEEATFLTKYASKIYIFVRGSKETMRASKIMQQRAISNSNIEFMFNTEVKDVLGKDKVTGVKLLNNATNTESTLDLSGLFVAIGHQPNTQFLNNLIDTDKIGYAQRQDKSETNIEGIFVAGDVHDKRYRQAITAAGYGCMAAIDVEKYLNEHGMVNI